MIVPTTAVPAAYKCHPDAETHVGLIEFGAAFRNARSSRFRSLSSLPLRLHAIAHAKSLVTMRPLSDLLARSVAAVGRELRTRAGPSCRPGSAWRHAIRGPLRRLGHREFHAWSHSCLCQSAHCALRHGAWQRYRDVTAIGRALEWTSGRRALRRVVQSFDDKCAVERF